MDVVKENPTKLQVVTIEMKFSIDVGNQDGGFFTRAVIDMARMLAQLAGIQWMGGEISIKDPEPKE